MQGNLRLTEVSAILKGAVTQNFIRSCATHPRKLRVNDRSVCVPLFFGPSPEETLRCFISFGSRHAAGRSISAWLSFMSCGIANVAGLLWARALTFAKSD